ncbi:MAG: hypothetical protein RL660_607 [Bacteroidota bacterium]|jgi:asparagine synthase (glutamine-hydrolysing)
MCGISGYISFSKKPVEIATLKAMTDVIEHRGPDGEGHWINDASNVGLAHRRLSIIDLSHAADQPMQYMDRFSIVFNGEIYNYVELKELLVKQGYHFHTQSDTEVLMALYHKHGKDCLYLLDGMFAFAIYDKQEQTLFCARDRFGEKPFFYNYIDGEHFVFGSEIKCLWAAGIDSAINDIMLFNYLSYGYTENPQDLSETFFRNATRLEHSHFIYINLKTNDFQIKRYYDIDYKNIDKSISIEVASERFRELFNLSVNRRLRSDVAVGSSLSGGLDSSLVVCTIDSFKSAKSQNTFSAVFPGFKKDERKYMDFVLKTTNANPHFVTPTDQGMLDDLQKLIWHQEEPFGSASIYAQYCVMRLAKEHNTTVLLDGQGADEVLAGYHAYYNPFFAELNKHDRSIYKPQLIAYNALHKNNPINEITKPTFADRIRGVAPQLIKPIKILKNQVKQTTTGFFTSDFYASNRSKVFVTPGNTFESLNHSLYSSTMKYGLQQLLRFADRNSMAHSREVRLPFLSHELVEFLFTLPATMKINDGWTKWIMRQTFENTMPKEIAWRTDKIGYEPPQQNWMQNKSVVDAINASLDRLAKNGYLNHKKVDAIRAKDKYETTGDKNWVFLMAGSLMK